jgi:hypothetical protein
MMLSDIHAEKDWGRKANHFIILSHHKSLLSTCYHWISCWFKSSRPDHFFFSRQSDMPGVVNTRLEEVRAVG